MAFSLLRDPLISVSFPHSRGETSDEKTQNERAVTLPRVLALFSLHGSGQEAVADVSFPVLRTHQRAPWHAFLSQLAALAISRTPEGETLASFFEAGSNSKEKSASFSEENLEATWTAALLSLSGGEESAWHLAVEDLSKPAFMQPPVPEGSLEEGGYKKEVHTPGDLDTLVTSKSHGVKRSRVASPSPEHWMFALLTLQTTAGFLGNGNYGIARMNGGFGNRPQVALSSSEAFPARFKRDVRVLLGGRSGFFGPEATYEYDLEGPALLWLLPWDGEKESAVPLFSCDPYVIEVSRRVRFFVSEKKIRCFRTTTKGQRLSFPEDLNGRTGDLWTPVNAAEEKVISLSETGFTYEKLHDLLFSGDYERSPALSFYRPIDGESKQVLLIAQAFVRGQGKTKGHHYRVVPVAEQVARSLFGGGNEEEKEHLGIRSASRISLAQAVEKKVLYPSVAALLSGGSGEGVDWEQASPFFESFDSAVNRSFFDHLFRTARKAEAEAEVSWQKFLFQLAESVFEDACDAVPLSSFSRHRALSKAESIFYGSARARLPKAFSEKES